jgi:hypothetical protein
MEEVFKMKKVYLTNSELDTLDSSLQYLYEYQFEMGCYESDKVINNLSRLVVDLRKQFGDE